MNAKLGPVGFNLLVFLCLVVVEIVDPVHGVVKVGVVIGEDDSQEVKNTVLEIVERYKNVKLGPMSVTPLLRKVLSNDTFNVTNEACSLLSQGIQAILSPSNGTVHEVLASISQKFQLPYISGSSSRAPTLQTTNFGVAVRVENQAAVASIIEKNAWRSIIYIYEESDGLDYLQEVLSKLKTNYKIGVKHVKRISNTAEATSFLQKLEKDDWDTEKYIVLNCRLETSKRIISYASVKKRNYYTFVITRYTTRSEWGSVSVVGSSQIIALELSKDMGNLKEEVALTHDAAEVVTKAFTSAIQQRPDILSSTPDPSSAPDCYKKPSIPVEHGSVIADFFRKVSFNGKTGNVTFDELGRRQDYTITILRQVAGETLREVGNWSQGSGLTISPAPEPKDPGVIKIITILEPAFLSQRTAGNGSSEGDGKESLPTSKPSHLENKGALNLHGYIKDLIHEVMNIVQKRYEIKIVADGKYGARDPKKESGWNGMIGDILMKDADIAIAPLTITSERSQVVYFTGPFLTSSYSVIVQNPPEETSDLGPLLAIFSFLKPMSWEIWLCLLAAYIGVAIILFLINRLNLAVSTESNPATTTNTCSHLYNSIWYSLGAFMAEECNNCRPKSIGSRIIACCWWFFVLVVISMYTAQMWVYQSLLPEERSNIKDVKGLARQSQIEYGLVGNSSLEDFFKGSKDSTYQRMWESMKTFNNTIVANTEEGISKLRESEGKFAFIVDSIIADHVVSKPPCQTKKIKSDFYPAGYGIACSLKSPLKEKLNQAVEQLRESETLARLEAKWFKAGTCKTTSTQGLTSGLPIIKVGGWFVILGCGLLIAIGVAIAEVWYKSRPEKKEKEHTEDAEKEEEKKLVESEERERTPNPQEEEPVEIKVPIADVETLDSIGDDAKDIIAADAIESAPTSNPSPEENPPEKNPASPAKPAYESSEV